MNARLAASTLILASLLWAAPASASPQGKKFGVGLALGSPSSVTGKYFVDHNLALDFGLDFLRYGGAFGFHGDFLWHSTPLVSNGDLELPLYIGGGAQLAFWNDGYYYHRHWGYWGDRDGFNMGLRMPLGMAVWLRKVPLEVHLELGPELWLLGPSMGLFGALGVRNYF
jgi:hypothetical protein